MELGFGADVQEEDITLVFAPGGNKATTIAMVLENSDIYLVSDLEPDSVKNIFLIPYSGVQTVFNAAMEKYGSNAVLVMPYGGFTLPRCAE